MTLCFALMVVSSCDDSKPAPPGAPHVFFITIDTLRADHLGSYGYPKNTSPNLDAFANAATLFEVAISQAPNTIPSVLQIMTSRYGLPSRIHGNQESLADLLRGNGYETAAIVENPLFEFDRDAHGLTQGFNQFLRDPRVEGSDLQQQLYETNTPAEVITARATQLLDAHSHKKPLFLWLHYFDPHDPYSAPSPNGTSRAKHSTQITFTGDIRREDFTKGKAPFPEPRDIEYFNALYDDEIRYVDASVGKLLAKLKRDTLYDQSLIIVSSDHGESLGEHNVWMHGRSLYESETRIPLIVKLPGQSKGRRVQRPVQAIDILPTIIDVLGIETNAHFDGSSLLDDTEAPALIVWLRHKVVRTREWKLYDIGDEASLFRIAEDPGETRNVAAEHPNVVANLRALRDARLDRAKQSATDMRALSKEANEQMRALGYIE